MDTLSTHMVSAIFNDLVCEKTGSTKYLLVIFAISQLVREYGPRIMRIVPGVPKKCKMAMYRLVDKWQ